MVKQKSKNYWILWIILIPNIWKYDWRSHFNERDTVLTSELYIQGCPGGSYQDLMEQDFCKECPIGHYCYANTSDYSPNICPAGYYCPVNTTQPHEYPCPAGTFNNLTAQHDNTACQSCTPGYYCQGDGNDFPTAQCDPGWYCTNGSDSARVSTASYTRS